MRGRIRTFLFQITPLLGFLVFWQIASRVVERGEFFFGSPTSVANSLVAKILDGSLIIDTAVTSYEALAGFVIGNLLGSIFGLSLWYSDLVSRVSRPYIVALGSVPIFAVAPIMILWFGIGIFSKIAMATISTIIVSVVQAYEGARNTDPEQIRLLYTLGGKKWHVFRYVIIPSSLTWVIAGYKLNVSFALLGAFIGEFISAEKGLGHLIMTSMGLFNIPAVLTGVACISLIALVFMYAIGKLERRVLHWRY